VCAKGSGPCGAQNSRQRAWLARLSALNLMRNAVVAGARYGLSCLGCSAALMVAMVLFAMSSLWWAVILGIVVLTDKFAPPLRMRYELVLSAALVALGVAHLMMA
jgi:predicted metal-binding membrane protein